MKTQMLKAESTGISSDFGGNPESTDVRAVRVMEKADDDDDEDGDFEKAASKMPASTGEAPDPPAADPPQQAPRRKAPPQQAPQQAGPEDDGDGQAEPVPAKKPNPFQKGIPGADAPPPEGSILGDEGDPEGKNLDTSDDAALQASQRMLNAGLKGWLAKAEGEEDEEVDPEADPNDLSDEDDGDEEMEGLSAQGDMEKASYTKRTGTPGNYKYEYADKASGHIAAQEKTAANISAAKDKGKSDAQWVAAHGSKGKFEAGHEPGSVRPYQLAPFGGSKHASAALDAEEAGDIAGAIEHHRAGMKADDDRYDAEADWERGDPIGSGKGFAAHNEALKRLGSPHHEPDPSNRPGATGTQVKKGNMTEIQKTGLNGWLKACSIPGAEDTSDGKDPAWGLPDGAPALDQGANVNGAMIDGMGREDRALANGNDTEDTTGSVDSGKGVSLSADDPAFGAMASGEPGCEHGTPEMSGSVGQGKGADLGGSLRGPGGTGGDLASLSKSRGFLPDRNDIYEQRSALARLQARGRGPADLRGVGVGRAGPQAAQVQGPVPTVIRKGQVVYSDASDLAVDAVMRKGDDSFFQNAGGISELRKSESCSSCGTAKPVWLSVCPECGGHAARAQLQKSEQPQGRLRLRVERDLVLPEGTKRTR